MSLSLYYYYCSSVVVPVISLIRTVTKKNTYYSLVITFLCIKHQDNPTPSLHCYKQSIALCRRSFATNYVSIFKIKLVVA